MYEIEKTENGYALKKDDQVLCVGLTESQAKKVKYYLENK